MIAAALGTGELAVRLSGEAATVSHVRDGIFRLSDDPQLFYELSPGAAGQGARVNDLGFRGEGAAGKKPPATFRVVFVGAGFTFGEEVPEAHTYPRLVEARVNAAAGARGRVGRLQALNLGVPGYVLPELMRRVENAASLQPDMVVLALGEPFADQRGDIIRGFDGRLDPDVEGVLLAKLGELSWAELLMRRSRFATLLLNRLRWQNTMLARRPRLVLSTDMRAKGDWTTTLPSLRGRLATARLIVVAFGDVASAQEVRERLAGEDLVTLSVVPTAGDDAQQATAEALLSGVMQRALPDGLRPFTGAP